MVGHGVSVLLGKGVFLSWTARPCLTVLHGLTLSTWYLR